MDKFQDFLSRKSREYGERFDASNLAPRFAPYLGTQTRIKVETCGIVKTGTIGVTTGWRPAFLLMVSSRSIGSPWVLGAGDKVLAIKADGARKYTPMAAYQGPST
jgi:hypothetical protein